MMLALGAALAAVLAFILINRFRNSGSGSAEETRETTPAMDAWLREALETELAEGALGMRASTSHERKKLKDTLAHDPDPDVVGKIEEAVKRVELEFVRYAHDNEVEATVRVRYTNGNTGTSTRQLSLSDVPEAVRADFEKKGSTRVFRSWSFPWQRLHAL